MMRLAVFAFLFTAAFAGGHYGGYYGGGYAGHYAAAPIVSGLSAPLAVGAPFVQQAPARVSAYSTGTDAVQLAQSVHLRPVSIPVTRQVIHAAPIVHAAPVHHVARLNYAPLHHGARLVHGAPALGHHGW